MGRMILTVVLVSLAFAAGAPSFAADGTSLSDPSVRFTVPDKPYVVLKRGPVEAVVVDNRAVDDGVIRGHRAGYSGVALLRHERRPENLFVPAYAGLNFEHIHDGTTQRLEVLYEPRNAPMELRVVGAHTAELYQKPTPHWGLESCQRYRLLEDGAIELTVECVPRKRAFASGYVGLFWASYIQRPERGGIQFLGRPDDGAAPRDGPDPRAPQWVAASSPAHGVEATHVGRADGRAFPHDPDFPMTLVFSRSKWRFDEPWYFGVNRGMAFAQLFRARDGVRFAQSPSGGGAGNPAWDFQFFIPEYEVGRTYRFVARFAYVPETEPEAVRRAVSGHLRALEKAE